MASPGQYFESEPAARSRPGTVELVLPDLHTTLRVDSGVFAARSVDTGTLELLKATSPPTGGHLLDLGCGYGPIACTLAHRSPAATVWAVDINRRALSLTAANAGDLGLANVRTATPDDIPSGVEFSGIWSNPPVRIGKAALHDLLQRWIPRLANGATAWLVVQKHLGSDSLQAWMNQQGWRADRIGSRKGYRLLRVQSRR
jgi:16S rRNA (guanine1207-N2)-methyltransferase